jgi:MFS family permease
MWCFPSGGLLQRFPIAKTMMTFQIMWGLVLIGTGFASSFESFVAMRVLLGAIEAPIAPGNFLVMACGTPDKNNLFVPVYSIPA